MFVHVLYNDSSTKAWIKYEFLLGVILSGRRKCVVALHFEFNGNMRQQLPGCWQVLTHVCSQSFHFSKVLIKWCYLWIVLTEVLYQLFWNRCLQVSLFFYQSLKQLWHCSKVLYRVCYMMHLKLRSFASKCVTGEAFWSTSNSYLKRVCVFLVKYTDNSVTLYE